MNDNCVMVIYPYLHKGTWVFDDEEKNLHREPFVAGIDGMLSNVVDTQGLDKNGFDKDGIKKEVEPETLEPETEEMTLTNDDYESPYPKGNSEPPDTFVIPPPDDDDGLPTPD